MSKRFNETNSGNKIFGVKRNNGSIKDSGYSNQCLWLSIIDYLNGSMGHELDLQGIRLIGSRSGTRINGIEKPFDSDRHYNSLLNVVETFDLQVHFYHSIRDRVGNLSISPRPNVIVGKISSSNVVSIVSYGSHFELITSINGIQLYNGITDSIDFIPNRELALGVSNDHLDEFNDTQLTRIDELLNISIYFGRIVSDLEQRLVSDQTKLDEFSNSFITNERNISSLREEEQIALVSSFQEHKMYLEKIINDTNNELIEMKKDMGVINEQLDMLIA